MWQATCWQCQNEISQCCDVDRKVIQLYMYILFQIICHYSLLQDVEYSSLCYTVIVQSLGCVWLFAASWTAAHQASPSFTISRSLQELTSIESVMPSIHLILCRPLLLPSTFRSIRVFSNELGLHIRWPKYWSFSFSNTPSSAYSGLISFRINFFFVLISVQSKGLSQESSPTPQFKSISSSVLSLPYGPTLSSVHTLLFNFLIDETFN